MVAKQPEGAKTMGWTQQRGTRFRALYRNEEGKTRSAGTFQYRYQAQEAADAAEGKIGLADRSELEGLTVLEYGMHWLSQRTALETATRNTYRNAIVNQIGPALGTVPVVELTKTQVRQWVARMEEDPAVGVATRNYSLKVLRMIVKVAIEDDDLVAKDPTGGIKRQTADLKAPRAFLGDEQVEELLESAETLSWLNSPTGGRRVGRPGDGMCRLAILLGVDAGLRWAEIAALNLESVVTVGNRMVLHIHRTTDRKGRIRPTTKNHQARDVPVTTDRLRRALSLRMKQARLEHGLESLVIYRADGSPVRYEHWKRVLLAGAYADAGITVATGWHDLRHTYGSRLAEKGVATKIIATLMGHAEEDITQIYLHPSTTEHLANVVGGALSG
jgi:integrase